ncbi:hypothetical protein MPSEU_000655600 [Mayamaea pseudoterrestris]|nr:hypothetical protein MPSEU_000655600 [Mayamaea pseudoterrestris]
MSHLMVSDHVLRPARGESSLRLCCLGPDERFLHSLIASSDGTYLIESRSRPFEEDDEGIDSDEPLDVPSFVRTELPDHVQESFRMDPPVEIFAIHGESLRTPLVTLDAQSSGRQAKILTQLCMYSRKSVFVVKLAFASADSVGSSRNPGEDTHGFVASTTEPFRQVLSDDAYSWSSLDVIRVRPAPTHAKGSVVLAPPGSLAMLMYHRENRLHTLSLFHAGLVTTTNATLTINKEHCLSLPLEFVLEDVLDELTGHDQRIVDFCFAASIELSLLSSLTILLIKNSGDVLAASPVVFHGTVAKAGLFEEALDYIRGQKDSATRGDFKWNQCRAAEQYLLDVFSPTNKAFFYTANMFVDALPSAAFPLQIQGPVLYASAIEPGPPALTIESFGNVGMVGIACGMENGNVDFAIISPSALLPRFSFEAKVDSYALDDAMMRLSCIVERVSLGLETGAQSARQTNASMVLLPDPIVETLLHVCTKTNLSTISTTAVRLTSRRLLGGKKHEDASTTLNTFARPCIHGSELHGAVVSGDAYAGHELIVRAHDGQVVCVDVAQSQAVHELEYMTERSATSENNQLVLTMSAPKASDDALQLLEDIRPFHEKIAPLLRQLEKGIGGLTQVVGSSTKSSDISPEQLAVAIQLHEECNQQIVLPLVELKKLTVMRQEALKNVVDSQQQQLSALSRTVASLQIKASTLTQGLVGAATNASILSERGVGLLQACKELVPTITQAEYDYFQDIQRVSTKCKQVEKELEAARATKVKLKGEPLEVDIDPEQAKLAKDMLRFSGLTLANMSRQIRDAEMKLHRALN